MGWKCQNVLLFMNIVIYIVHKSVFIKIDVIQFHEKNEKPKF